MKRQEEKPKTWLDGLVGWEPEGNVVETWWCDDPAIDPELSDLEEYARSLDKTHLAVRPGQTPVRMLVSLPTAAQWGNIRPHLQELGLDSAAIIAFELCVRFPDVAAAEPTHRLGFHRLTERFMNAVVLERPVMVRNVGCWLINRYSLTEQEKKNIIARVHEEELLGTGLYTCRDEAGEELCSDRVKKLNGCPDLGPESKPGTSDGVIWVGSCGTKHKRWDFDRCPGAYLRRPGARGWVATVDGIETAFDKAWRGHWAYSTGHGIGDPPPPKLWQAVQLLEMERRAREALELEAERERRKRPDPQGTRRVIAEG